jgi:hypothetical protein
MRNFTIYRLAALALIALTGAAVSAPSAQAKICPQFIAKYCVYNKDHLIFSAFTNPCFASEKGWTVIYLGGCKFGKA